MKTCKFEVGHNYGNLDNSIEYYKENPLSDIFYIKDTSGAIVSFNVDEAENVIRQLNDMTLIVIKEAQQVQQEGR